MKLGVYTVFDKAVNAFMQPFFCRSKGEAIRSFTEACSDKDSNFHKYASDYTLMELGLFDDGAGMFECFDPVRIIGAVECLPDTGVEIERAPPLGARNGRMPM